MVLIIPTIPIVHGVCAAQIATQAKELHTSDREIYSQSPIDRARLLRKENAKTIHLEFWDSDPWSQASLAIIHDMRLAVDIPFELMISEIPQDICQLEKLFDAGIYRIFLPLEATTTAIFSLLSHFPARKLFPTFDLSITEEILDALQTQKVCRIALEISTSDCLEWRMIDWVRLKEVTLMAAKRGIRITALHGVRGYPDLKLFQEMGIALDSLVLSRALNENRFPCQLIWREVEALAAIEHSPADNLWSNPLGARATI